MGTLANPTGSPVQAPLEAEESLGARPGTRGKGQSSQYEQTPRYFWLPGSVPHVVGGGTLGTPASLSGFPPPPWAEAKSTRLVSAVGVGPATPLLSARCHIIRYFIPSSHQNVCYTNPLN